METIDDIVREMREYVNAEAFIQHEDGDVDFVDICGELADRIEAAAKAERIAHETNTKVMGDIVCRLRAALKPVLEWSEDDPYSTIALEAVLESQRIYNESEAK